MSLATSLKVPALTVALFSLALPLHSQSTEPSSSAQDLARKVVASEVRISKEDQSLWSYQKTSRKPGGDEERAVIQTKDGDLDRLLLVNGKPLNAREQKQESDRIKDLIHNPSERRKLQERSQKDADQMTRILKVLPDALLFSNGERRGDSVQLLFKPNPKYHPTSRETHVLSTLAGEMWVDARQNRIEEVSGHVTHEVRFGGGFAGHLDKGGTFEVKQAEVGPGHWEITKLDVHMKGKALLLKSISIQQSETRSHFQHVSDKLTLEQAAEMLSRREVLAGMRSQ